MQLPWKPEVAWVAGDPWMDGKPVAQAPRLVLKRLTGKVGKQGMNLKAGVEPEFHLINADGSSDLRSSRYPGEALLRPIGHHAPLRCDR